MAEFLALDGYGIYVWPCYGLAAIMVIGLYWHSHIKLAASQKPIASKKND